MNALKTSTLLILSVFMFVAVSAQSTQGWTSAKAAEWFKNREWAGKMKLSAHESVNKIEFARQYTKNKALWNKAFAWFATTNIDTVKSGKYLLDSTNLFVTITEGPTKAFEDTKWEAHKKYIDIQYIARGKEKMGIAPLVKATEVVAFDATKDVGFYTVPEADGKFYVAEPGTFLIFFPSDVHRPNTKVDGFDTVKKVVFKVKAD